MTTTINRPHEANVGNATGNAVAIPELEAGGHPQAPRLTTDQVWRALGKASFAIVSYVTPSGAPRSSGVVYTVVGRKLYLAVAPDGWKAKHVAISGQVAVTVPVRRGGLLSLLFPIPPATVSFHGAATVHSAGSAEIHSLSKQLESLLPAERRASSTIIEIIPQGQFVTYGLGVSLMAMASPAKARGQVPVT